MNPNPSLYLKQQTERVIAAAQTEDLDALKAALEARAQVLRVVVESGVGNGVRNGAGDAAEQRRRDLAHSLEVGENALAALRATKRRLQTEHSRWQQMRQGFGQTGLDQTGFDQRSFEQSAASTRLLDLKA